MNEFTLHQRAVTSCIRLNCPAALFLGLMLIFSPYICAFECQSSLVVRMFDSYGKIWKVADIQISSVSGNTVKSARGSKVTFSNLPCGDYIVKASAILGSISTVYTVAHVGASQREVFLGLPIRFGDWEGEYGIRSITGHIVADGGLQPDLWIRLESLYLPIRLDAKPDNKGHFRFDGLEGGYYSVFIYRGNSLILTREVEIDLVGPEETALELRLPRED